MGSHRRPLRILHIDPERAWGGGERQVIGLLSHLSGWGHENHLLCHPGGRLSTEAQAIGIRTYPLSVRNDLDLRPVFRLRRLIRAGGYDVVHFHTKRAHALTLWLGNPPPGLKRVVTRRMDYPVRRGWYDRYLYNRQVDGVIAISRKIAQLLTEGGVSRERIRVIHSGVDPRPFQKARQRSDDGGPPVVIGTVAVLEARKGHRFLLEAAAYLKQQGRRLIYRIAGDGSEKERLHELTRALGLQEEVSFEGFVSDVAAFLSAIDIFVLPSLFEGLGVAVLEAMAAGKPVVATDVGGLREIVEQRHTGLLVAPADSLSLAAAISELGSRWDLMRQMGDHGRERVRGHFTMEQMAMKNEDYYYELLGEGRDARQGIREASRRGV